MATVLFPDGIRTMKVDELDLSYRHSIFTDHPEAVVLGAKIRLKKGDKDTIKARMDELAAKRKASQPLEYPSAGSTFKRPVGNFAGTLIDETGLKGLQVGGAQISTKHAGFVVNSGNATAADVLNLIKEVQDRVYAKNGVRLFPEVRIIGEQ